MIYELRTYHVLPRKMPAEVELFEKILPIFQKNGITVVGLWTTVIGRAQNFVYMLKYDSLADREVKWNKFVSDPEIAKVIGGTDPISQYEDNVILEPVPFSPLP